MNPDCLHCVLAKAAKKWLAAHHASTEAIIQMLGRFTAEAIASCPEHQGEDVEILIMGIMHSNRGKLH